MKMRETTAYRNAVRDDQARQHEPRRGDVYVPFTYNGVEQLTTCINTAVARHTPITGAHSHISRGTLGFLECSEQRARYQS